MLYQAYQLHDDLIALTRFFGRSDGPIEMGGMVSGTTA